MGNGIILGIAVSHERRKPMQLLTEVMALAGKGLEGDRYAEGAGSYNLEKVGSRQVTLINARFFQGSGYSFLDSRRNICVAHTELLWLIGREFRIGKAMMRGVKYCDPCDVPTALAGKTRDESFRMKFEDCGGIIAEVIESGMIAVHSALIPPPKGY